jgi:hypothetical protein
MKNHLFLLLLAVLISPLCYGQGSGGGSLRLTDRQFDRSDSIYFKGKIQSDGHVFVPGDVRLTLVSGQEVVIGPGFDTQPGAIFTAYVRKDSGGAVQPDGMGAGELAGKDLVVYPNPASGVVHVMSARPIGKLIVADVSGRIVQTIIPATAAGSIMDINLSGLPAGLYTLFLIYPERCVCRKIILAK